MFPWGDDRRFNSYNRFLKQRFGGRVQKLTLDAGFTCPNRDGTVGIGGCTYCCNDAFNPAYCDPGKSIRQQIDEGIRFHHRPGVKPAGYFAYFQAFSNTYAPLTRLRDMYEEATAHPSVLGLIIATRPDCIDNPLLDYLQELQEHIFVTLEIGMESCRNETLRRINRGHDVACAVRAIEQAASHHIPVGTHLIFGLPGERPEHWLEDLSLINHLPLHSIKLHQLQIIRDTVMEAEYRLHPNDFFALPFDTYVSFIADYVERLSPDIIIERFAAEVPPRFLSTTGWGGIRYDQVIQAIEKELNVRNSWQGRFVQF
jgi:radical SAM protein (TIGR01212 family)